MDPIPVDQLMAYILTTLENANSPNTTTTTLPPFLTQVTNVRDREEMPLNSWMADPAEANVFHLMLDWPTLNNLGRQWEFFMTLKRFAKVKIDELFQGEDHDDDDDDGDGGNMKAKGHAEIKLAPGIMPSDESERTERGVIAPLGVLVKVVCRPGPAPEGQGYGRIPMREFGTGFVYLNVGFDEL